MINLTDNFNLNKPAHLDGRVGPWESTGDAIIGVPFDKREIGLTIVVDNGSGAVEYWWKSGLADGDLELKSSGGGGSFNCSDLLTCTTFTDLQTEVAGKFDIPTGTTAQYLDGVGTPTDFPTAGQSGTLVREIRNETGATLTKGTAVYISGASGNKAVVSKAIATGDTTSAQTFGIIQADIPNNQNGFVVVRGDLAGLDTTAFTEGAQLYLSSTTAGALTMVKQYAPNHLVYIGIVTRVHANQGSIEVAIQNGYELDELHNVSAQTPTNRNGLFFNSTTNLWESRAIAGADLPSGIDATKLANGNVTNAEFQTLDGVTSAIQTQLNSKEPTITAGTTSQFFRGDKTFQPIGASDVPKVVRPSVRFLTPVLSGNQTTEQVLTTISIPANTLVVNDIIKIGVVWSFSSNAGTKTPRVRLGNNTIIGNQVYSPASISASVNSVQMEVLAIVTSSTNLKLFPSATSSGYGTGTGAVTNNTISLSSAIDFTITIQKATAGDTASLEFAYIEILTS